MVITSRRWFGFTSRERYKKSASNDAWHLTHKSVAKENSSNSAYLIPNEWICSQIAQFLRLPVPPASLMRASPARKGMFACLEFGSPESVPDDADPTACVKQHPDLCTGILLFDILVANPDRHTGNIHVDDPFMPSEINIFDHDHALLGIWKDEALKRLTDLRDRLGISGGSATGENRHCLLDVLDTREYMRGWIRKIKSIPPWFLAGVCGEVTQVGITREEANAAIDFLSHRAEQLPVIIYENRQDFSGIKSWGLFNDLDL